MKRFQVNKLRPPQSKNNKAEAVLVPCGGGGGGGGAGQASTSGTEAECLI